MTTSDNFSNTIELQLCDNLLHVIMKLRRFIPISWWILFLLLALLPRFANSFGVDVNMDVDAEENDLFNMLMLEDSVVSLDQERNPMSSFQFLSINTKVPQGYQGLPKKSAILARGHTFHEVKDCKVFLDLELLNFDSPKGRICLFQDVVKSYGSFTSVSDHFWANFVTKIL